MAAFRRILLFLPLAVAASPALAKAATTIPEPDTIAIFVLAGAGLILGRRLSR